jgi:rare lipoprotein A (peptidoglycan hydrolase)
MSLEYFVQLALSIGISTTYGYGEMYCCDPGKACPCTTGQYTASGEMFDTEKATAAIPLPVNMRIVPTVVHLQIENGPCVPIKLNDKMNSRFIGKRGFDLSPRAIELLTGKPRTPKWVGRVYPCNGDKR